MKRLTALLLFLSITPAHADPVAIDRWCKTPEIYHEIIAAFVGEGPKAAAGVARDAGATGVCVRLPAQMAVGFEPKEIVKRYSKGLDGAEVVISGELPDGQTVYIWINKGDTGDFFPES